MNAKPPEPGQDPRFFSLEEAERMLPLVRRIVDDIVEQFESVEPLVARYNEDPDGGADLRAQIESRSDHLDELIAELHELGCLFKGPRAGLVDWYSYYVGRPVFLCWKRGEQGIGFWHQVDAGFAGRQPILDSQRSAFRSTPPGG